jgi:hypothetical protein
MAQCPELEQKLHRYGHRLAMQTTQIAACNRLHEVDERLARWILMSQDRLDSKQLPLTQEFLAQMLGTRRASVTVAAGILQKAGLISYTRATSRSWTGKSWKMQPVIATTSCANNLRNGERKPSSVCTASYIHMPSAVLTGSMFPRILFFSSLSVWRGGFMATRAGYQHYRIDEVSASADLSAGRSSAALQSWKEIASELNRGVRTVQRWERDLGLPVRRIGRSRRAPVFAFKNELHSWLRTSGGIQACGVRALSTYAQPEVEDKSARNTELLQALEKLFAAEPSTHSTVECSECGCPMRLLNGYFWIYGSRKKRRLSIPICPECNIEFVEAVNRSQRLHIQ